MRTAWPVLLETIHMSGFGVSVVYTGEAEEASAESELVRDMLAIVTSFAGRLYGQRSAKTKRLRAAVAAETRLTEEELDDEGDVDSDEEMSR